jgi:hypothetical protein
VKPPVIIGLLAGLIYTTTSLPANARCYSRWYYPWAQNCGVAYHGHARRMASLQLDHPSPPVHDIPLPDMSADWGGTLDSELELSLLRQKAIRQLTHEGN